MYFNLSHVYRKQGDIEQAKRFLGQIALLGGLQSVSIHFFLLIVAICVLFSVFGLAPSDGRQRAGGLCGLREGVGRGSFEFASEGAFQFSCSAIFRFVFSLFSNKQTNKAKKI